MVKATLVSGDKRWNIIGAYIPPSDEEGVTLEFLTNAYTSIQNPAWPVIVMGDLNVDFQDPDGNNVAGRERRLQTASLMEMWGLRSAADCFRKAKKRMWRRC